MQTHKQQRRGSTRDHLANTSGRVFQHMNTACFKDSRTVNAAHALWVKSMLILPESLDINVQSMPAYRAETPLDVQLLLHVNSDRPSIASTEYSLAIQISPTCTKTFEFSAGAAVQIPMSTKRPTRVTVLSVRGGSTVPLQNFVVDVKMQKTSPAQATMLLPEYNSAYIVCAVLNTARTSAPTTGPDTDLLCSKAITFKFPCFAYQRDVDSRPSDCDMRQVSVDLAMLEDNPAVLPQGPITTVSSADAEALMAKLEYTRRQLLDVMQNCCRSTAVAELGATEDDAAETMRHVDWKRSYCVPCGAHIAEVMVLARDLHHQLASMANVAVDRKWLFAELSAGEHTRSELTENVGKTVRGLLHTRGELCARVAARRTDLNCVVRVRTCFLLISAIDDALRSVCDLQKHARATNNAFTADGVSCHAYWLGQMRSNTHNSISMDDLCYGEAVAVLSQCKRVKDSGSVLMPQCSSRLSSVGHAVWQNMHLQGIRSEDSFVVASVPHFMYKQKQVIDFSKHPFVLALQRGAGQPAEQPSAQPAEQLQSAKLMAILVSHDVEHRIITPATLATIEHQWTLACSQDRNAANARDFLCALFDPSVKSLIDSALGVSSGPDLSFLTDAGSRPAVTGYDSEQLTKTILAHIANERMPGRMF